MIKFIKISVIVLFVLFLIVCDKLVDKVFEVLKVEVILVV